MVKLSKLHSRPVVGRTLVTRTLVINNFLNYRFAWLWPRQQRARGKFRLLGDRQFSPRSRLNLLI